MNNRPDIGTIVDSASTGLLAADMDGRITYINKTAAEILKLDANDLLDAPLSAFLPNIHNLVLESLETGKAGAVIIFRKRKWIWWWTSHQLRISVRSTGR
ncbi:MAG: PAS domain-containing protein [Thermodesulfobacteriota bacterium]